MINLDDLITASDVNPGQTIYIKTAKHQKIGVDAPAWTVADREVIEVGNTVTSVYWHLTDAAGERYEYAPHPKGRYTLA